MLTLRVVAVFQMEAPALKMITAVAKGVTNQSASVSLAFPVLEYNAAQASAQLYANKIAKLRVNAII
jgi:hypothetical protein